MIKNKKNLKFKQIILIIITMEKTRFQIKKEFEQLEMSISDWSLKHNFSRDLVYRILNTNRLPQRGESKRIAIALGLIPEEKEE